MAASDTVFVKTNAGRVPAVVLRQYNSSGVEIDTALGVFTNVDTVDVLLLGVDSGYRAGLDFAATEAAASVNDAFPTATS